MSLFPVQLLTFTCLRKVTSMNAFVFTLTTLSALLGQFDPSPACNSPNCRHDHSSVYSSQSVQFGPATNARRYSPADRSIGTNSCGCATCDPNIPCSDSRCQDQGCKSCNQGLFQSRSSRLPNRGPASAQPTGNDATFRSQPTPQARAQRLCPVTGEELGSMGPPIAVNAMGKRIYVCCDSCVAAVRRNPEKYLQKVIDELAPVRQPPSRASRPREDYLR